MKENKVQFIAITAMAVALTYVFTAFVNVDYRSQLMEV